MNKSIYSDKELFELISQDSKEAFEIVFNKYYTVLVRVLTRYSHDSEQVKDWIQEIYVRLWENRKVTSMAGVENAPAYFIISARNHALKSLSKKKKVQLVFNEQEEIEIADNNLEEKLHHEELWTAYRRALTKLPPRTHQAYYLNREQGMTYEKVAEQLGTSIKTVEAQIARALAILRHELVSFMH